MKTPEERAEAITKDWKSVGIGYEWGGAPSMHPLTDEVYVYGDIILGVNQLIAAAIREAVAAEREACAKLAESKCKTWDEEGDGESVMASQAYYGMADAGRSIAADIRKRGNA